MEETFFVIKPAVLFVFRAGEGCSTNAWAWLSAASVTLVVCLFVCLSAF